MQGLMLRLDAAVHRHRRRVIAAWVVVLAVAIPFSLRQSDHLSSGGFAVPGSGSQRVAQAIDRGIPGAERTSLAVVLIPERAATPAALAAAVERARTGVAGVDRVRVDDRVWAPARARAAQAGDPSILVLPLRVDASEDEATEVALDLRRALEVTGARDGVATRLAGQGALWAALQDVTKEDLATAERAGFPLVLLILLGVFGSLTAAALPLALGAFSVLITGALIYAASLALEMSVFVTNMASMIGIGVAIDYSLFVLARYREEIDAGHAPDAARSRAMATSGLAVIFSGLTVMVSLAGLWMIDNTAIRSMALGAILVVAVSLLGSATLLPALIRVFGRRTHARRRLRRGARPGAAPGRFWDRWTRLVMRRPVLSLVASAAVLLTLAIPALSLEMGSGALRQLPRADETRAGMEAAASVSAPGAQAPVKVLVTGGGEAAAERVVAGLRRDPEVERVAGVLAAEDGRARLVTAVPRSDGESDAAKAMVKRLRETLPAAAGPGVRVDVGGITAAESDIEALISGSMWKVLLFVLGLSYLVLLILLRSVLLPLKAVAMNLLSVGAAYGILVAIFQWGWLDGVLGFESRGHIDTLTPPLVLAVVFGLSMDYEVFLLSRIRERHEATGDTQRAVAEGLARSARTITSAALIMVAVFAVFVGTGVPSIKELGLGCAVAIALDATLVRLVLVPAAMVLLGGWNWWLPRPLARVLPRTSIEELPDAAPVPSSA